MEGRDASSKVRGRGSSSAKREHDVGGRGRGRGSHQSRHSRGNARELDRIHSGSLPASANFSSSLRVIGFSSSKMTVGELKLLCATFGDVLDARLLDPTPSKLGVAVISFSSVRDAAHALTGLQGQAFGGGVLSVSFFTDVQDDLDSVTEPSDDVNQGAGAIVDDDSPVCLICCEPFTHVALGACNHRSVCALCSVRLRVLYAETACAVCKNECTRVVVTEDAAKSFDMFMVDDLVFDKVWRIWFDEANFLKEMIKLRELCCSQCKTDEVFASMKDLKHHMKTQHSKQFCGVCLKGRRVFISEQRLYTDSQIEVHMTKGDREDRKGGVLGHPRCQFCQIYCFNNDELYSHLNKSHFSCHICEAAAGRYIYFDRYESLFDHFEHEHFPCHIPECREKKFVVFRSEIDLKAHTIQEHSDGKITRADRRVDVGSLSLQYGGRSSTSNEPFSHSNNSMNFPSSRGTTNARQTSDFQRSVDIPGGHFPPLGQPEGTDRQQPPVSSSVDSSFPVQHISTPVLNSKEEFPALGGGSVSSASSFPSLSYRSISHRPPPPELSGSRPRSCIPSISAARSVQNDDIVGEEKIAPPGPSLADFFAGVKLPSGPSSGPVNVAPPQVKSPSENFPSLPKVSKNADPVGGHTYKPGNISTKLSQKQKRNIASSAAVIPSYSYDSSASSRSASSSSSNRHKTLLIDEMEEKPAPGLQSNLGSFFDKLTVSKGVSGTSATTLSENNGEDFPSLPTPMAPLPRVIPKTFRSSKQPSVAAKVVVPGLSMMTSSYSNSGNSRRSNISIDEMEEKPAPSSGPSLDAYFDSLAIPNKGKPSSKAVSESKNNGKPLTEDFPTLPTPLAPIKSVPLPSLKKNTSIMEKPTRTVSVTMPSSKSVEPNRSKKISIADMEEKVAPPSAASLGMFLSNVSVPIEGSTVSNSKRAPPNFAEKAEFPTLSPVKRLSGTSRNIPAAVIPGQQSIAQLPLSKDELRAANADIVGRLKSLLGTCTSDEASTFQEFKLISMQFQRGEITPSTYFENFLVMFPTTQAKADGCALFRELVELLPDISKQKMLNDVMAANNF